MRKFKLIFTEIEECEKSLRNLRGSKEKDRIKRTEDWIKHLKSLINPKVGEFEKPAIAIANSPSDRNLVRMCMENGKDYFTSIKEYEAIRTVSPEPRILKYHPLANFQLRSHNFKTV